MNPSSCLLILELWNGIPMCGQPNITEGLFLTTKKGEMRNSRVEVSPMHVWEDFQKLILNYSFEIIRPVWDHGNGHWFAGPKWRNLLYWTGICLFIHFSLNLKIYFWIGFCLNIEHKKALVSQTEVTFLNRWIERKVLNLKDYSQTTLN